MDFLKLTSEKLDPTEISELVVHEECGAVALFAGTTRDNFEGKQVVSLQYESYDEMAKKEMANICFEIRQRWPDVKHIAMYHRLGLVPVKEASVVIAISSPHRKSSLEALPFALDELKRSVPVWKKEFYKVDADNEQKRFGKDNFHFEDCHVVDELELPEAFVQITVDESEIRRRIDAFISQKREEINRNNLTDFIEMGSEHFCARTASNVYRIRDSKGHLRIKRVRNENESLDAISALKPDGNLNENFSSIDERLQNSENFLKLKSSSIPKDVYQRLKIIEEHISHFQSISPEYSKFLDRSNPTQKTVYSVKDLNQIIVSMESKKL